MAELGFRPTEVQYKGSSYGSSCDTFYNRNTVTAGIHTEITRAGADSVLSALNYNVLRILVPDCTEHNERMTIV